MGTSNKLFFIMCRAHKSCFHRSEAVYNGAKEDNVIIVKETAATEASSSDRPGKYVVSVNLRIRIYIYLPRS